MWPDRDYGTTIDNLDNLYGIDTDLRCWLLESIPMREVDPYQLNEEATEEAEDRTWIDGLRNAIRAGDVLPPVIIVHDLNRRAPYNLIEGQHRFNAVHREGDGSILAWVAHPGCCGGAAP